MEILSLFLGFLIGAVGSIIYLGRRRILIWLSMRLASYAKSYAMEAARSSDPSDLVKNGLSILKSMSQDDGPPPAEPSGTEEEDPLKSPGPTRKRADGMENIMEGLMGLLNRPEAQTILDRLAGGKSSRPEVSAPSADDAGITE